MDEETCSGVQLLQCPPLSHIEEVSLLPRRLGCELVGPSPGPTSVEVIEALQTLASVTQPVKGIEHLLCRASEADELTGSRPLQALWGGSHAGEAGAGPDEFSGAVFVKVRTDSLEEDQGKWAPSGEGEWGCLGY